MIEDVAKKNPASRKDVPSGTNPSSDSERKAHGEHPAVVVRVKVRGGDLDAGGHGEMQFAIQAYAAGSQAGRQEGLGLSGIGSLFVEN